MKINYKHPALEYCNPLTGEYDENINENGEIYVDATYEVCPTCEGHGFHFRSDLDENNLIDGMQEDGDYEGIESYYSGAFDESCNQCAGQRVVQRPNLPKWAEIMVYHWRQSQRESEAISAAERRVGA